MIDSVWMLQAQDSKGKWRQPYGFRLSQEEADHMVDALQEHDSRVTGKPCKHRAVEYAPKSAGDAHANY